jgi:hypothetical protein
MDIFFLQYTYFRYHVFFASLLTLCSYRQTVAYLLSPAKEFVHLLQNGFVSGIPELCKFAFSLVFSAAMDYMLRKEYLSITTVRKISVATS